MKYSQNASLVLIIIVNAIMIQNQQLATCQARGIIKKGLRLYQRMAPLEIDGLRPNLNLKLARQSVLSIDDKLRSRTSKLAASKAFLSVFESSGGSSNDQENKGFMGKMFDKLKKTGKSALNTLTGKGVLWDDLVPIKIGANGKANKTNDKPDSITFKDTYRGWDSDVSYRVFQA